MGGKEELHLCKIENSNVTINHNVTIIEFNAGNLLSNLAAAIKRLLGIC